MTDGQVGAPTYTSLESLESPGRLARGPLERGRLAAGYEIRLAVASDVAKLSAIEVAAGELFRGIGMADIADDEAFEPEVYEAAREAGQVWVAAYEGEPVGYALALQLGDQAQLEYQAHLEQLSVDPAHGRQGLGAALVGAVSSWAAGLGAPDLTLSTFRDVAWNLPYYERLGFEVMEEEQWSPGLWAVRAHEAADGLDLRGRVIMRLRLPVSVCALGVEREV